MFELLFYIFVGVVGTSFYDNVKDDYKRVTSDKKATVIKINVLEKEIPKEIILNKKIDGCETEITEIFYSKASGKITICKGKLLEVGQKTRVIEVQKWREKNNKNK